MNQTKRPVNRELLVYYEVVRMPARSSTFSQREILWETFSQSEAETVKGKNRGSTLLKQHALADSEGNYYRVASIKPLKNISRAEVKSPRGLPPTRKDGQLHSRVYLEVAGVFMSVHYVAFNAMLREAFDTRTLNFKSHEVRELQEKSIPEDVIVHQPLTWTDADWYRMVPERAPIQEPELD